MPIIEIQELHVRVNVSENNASRRESRRAPRAQQQKEDIVQACVERVLEVLKQQEKR